MQISKSNIDFLKQLSKNNNRDWFQANKATAYQSALDNTIAFADCLLSEMKKHDNIETVSGKKSLYRIYKDIRFSKDKTPYKTHWGGYFKRATNHLRGGYYFHIQPGNCFVGGGFWNPNPEDLKRIRLELAADGSELRKIIGSKNFIDTFGQLDGNQVKTAPKGFSKQHENIDLLRYKQFLVSKKFTEKEMLAKDFYKEVNKVFENMRPFFDYMSEVLTTDENGESLYD
jgi:uncharacterized protein (TIGR02453 family)